MTNQYVNKVEINGVTKIDLTSDTVTASDLRNGVTAHAMSGEPITGTLLVPSVESGKTYEALSNGTVTISPSSGYDAMDSVVLTVAIPSYTDLS